jgi:hypothetical protein
MILELLKLKSLAASHLISRGEAVMVKRYQRKANLENKIKVVQSAVAPTLTIEDIQSLLDRNSGVTLQIDGKEINIAPANLTVSATSKRTGEKSTVSSSAVVLTEAVITEDGTEAAVTETILETIVVPEPTEELLSEINECFSEVTFTATEVDEIISTISQPKVVVSSVVDNLPEYNSTMSLAKISISRPDEDHAILTGTFISSSIFSGCGDADCDACGEGGEDEDGAIIMHYVPDDSTDRSVMTLELEPGLIATLAL